MFKINSKAIRRLNMVTHRDLGYFFSTLVIIYCISGIALNHINDWNPDFIINKQTIHIQKDYTTSTITPEEIQKLGLQVGEEKYKIYDFPTPNQVKIYYDNASLHVYFDKKEGIFEKISRRPLFYHVNVIHRNSIKGWQWFSDIFAIMLIITTVTGLFILKGKHGIGGRGKWLMLAGVLPLVVAFILNEVL